MKHFTPLLLLVLIAGCAAKPDKSAGQAVVKPIDLTNPPSLFPRDSGPRDAQPEPLLLVSLSVYRLLVPARAVSHDETFWKHVDEHAVDPETYAQLYVNGIRVGVAPRSDWDYFKKILESDSPVASLSNATASASTIEMPVKKDVPEQFISYYHPVNGLTGQIYGRSENSMLVRFEPVPRHPGDVRVILTPLIRAFRTEIQWTVRNESRELEFVRPEALFDLKLSVNVPLNNFLVVAPSTEADNSTSLGRKFLYFDGNGQEFEQVLLISPQPFQFDKPTTKPTTQQAVGVK